jgi:hypothetical protein
MRHHGNLVIAAGVVLTAIAGLAAVVPAEKAGTGKTRVFMLQGGGHDWQVHLPMLAKILEETGDFTVSLSEDLNELRAEKIQNYDVVLFYGSGQNFSDPAQEQGLCGFVRNGRAPTRNAGACAACISYTRFAKRNIGCACSRHRFGANRFRRFRLHCRSRFWSALFTRNASFGAVCCFQRIQHYPCQMRISSISFRKSQKITLV